MATAIYPFSADPITFGHIDVIKRASKIFDRLVVAIGNNSEKKHLFSQVERIEFTKRVLRDFDNLEIVSFNGLLTDLAFAKNIQFIVRGFRNSNDYLHELNLYQNYLSQNNNLEFINLFSNANFISSSAAKEIVRLQGNVYNFVPLFIKKKLEEKILDQYTIAITGQIAVGKSYIANQLAQFLQKKIDKSSFFTDPSNQSSKLVSNVDFSVYNIDLDEITHRLLDTDDDLLLELEQNFGAEIFENQTFGSGKNDKNKPKIDRKKLGKLVFGRSNLLAKLEEIIHPRILFEQRKIMKGKKGIFILQVPLLAEKNLGYLANNQFVTVQNSLSSQATWLQNRGLNQEDILVRIKSQWSYDQKIKALKTAIQNDDFGWLHELFNDEKNHNSDQKIYKAIYESLTA